MNGSQWWRGSMWHAELPGTKPMQDHRHAQYAPVICFCMARRSFSMVRMCCEKSVTSFSMNSFLALEVGWNDWSTGTCISCRP